MSRLKTYGDHIILLRSPDIFEVEDAEDSMRMNVAKFLEKMGILEIVTVPERIFTPESEVTVIWKLDPNKFPEETVSKDQQLKWLIDECLELAHRYEDEEDMMLPEFLKMLCDDVEASC